MIQHINISVITYNNVYISMKVIYNHLQSTHSSIIVLVPFIQNKCDYILTSTNIHAHMQTVEVW